MISFFLRTKHWVLFLLGFLLPFFIYIALMIQFVTKMSMDPNPDPTAIFGIFNYFPLLFLVPMFIQYGWFWSVGIGLKRYHPENSGLRYNLFQVLFIIQILLLIGFFLFFRLFLEAMANNIENPDPNGFTSMLWFFPLQIITVVISFYMYGFCGRAIKIAELKQPVNFGDALGEFFLVWFFPIGIWFLQPRINRIVSGAIQDGTSDALDSGL